MKSIDVHLRDQLVALAEQKKNNFGGIPDDYRDLVEGVLSKDEAALFLLTQQSQAATSFPEFITFLKESGAAYIKKLHEDEDSAAFAVCVDGGGKLNPGEIIRKNWKLFEPVLMALYVGMKMGRQMERDEQGEFSKIVKTGEVTAELDASTKPILLSDGSGQTGNSGDTGLPAITPEQEARFRDEMNRAMKSDKNKQN
jgi:hypothetical protein